MKLIIDTGDNGLDREEVLSIVYMETHVSLLLKGGDIVVFGQDEYIDSISTKLRTLAKKGV